ncbi:unnamed protein product [Lathyrus oleraceus]
MWKRYYGIIRDNLKKEIYPSWIMHSAIPLHLCRARFLSFQKHGAVIYY